MLDTAGSWPLACSFATALVAAFSRGRVSSADGSCWNTSTRASVPFALFSRSIRLSTCIMSMVLQDGTLI